MPARLTAESYTLAVIIPVFNRAELVSRAVNSVLRQAREGVRIIVVDDGSTDEVLAPAGSGAAVQIVRIEHAGVSTARNAGVNAAFGASWVAFLDSDDEAMEGWVDGIISAIDDGSPRLFCCGARYHWLDGSQQDFLPSPAGATREDLNTLFLAGTFAVQRNLFLGVGGYRSGLQFGENTDLGWRLQAELGVGEGRVVSVDRPLVLVHAERRPFDPAVRLASARMVLADPPALLVEDRKSHALYYAIAGVSASRLGDRRSAVSLLVRAVRLDPREPRHLARLARAAVGRKRS